MRIASVPHSSEWIVLAEWYGQEREVARGDIFECLRFVNDQEV